MLKKLFGKKRKIQKEKKADKLKKEAPLVDGKDKEAKASPPQVLLKTPIVGILVDKEDKKEIKRKELGALHIDEVDIEDFKYLGKGILADAVVAGAGALLYIAGSNLTGLAGEVLKLVGGFAAFVGGSIAAMGIVGFIAVGLYGAPQILREIAEAREYRAIERAQRKTHDEKVPDENSHNVKRSEDDFSHIQRMIGGDNVYVYIMRHEVYEGSHITADGRERAKLRGVAMARGLKQRLGDDVKVVVHHSPITRARETAEAFVEGLREEGAKVELREEVELDYTRARGNIDVIELAEPPAVNILVTHLPIVEKYVTVGGDGGRDPKPLL